MKLLTSRWFSVVLLIDDNVAAFSHHFLGSWSCYRAGYFFTNESIQTAQTEHSSKFTSATITSRSKNILTTETRNPRVTIEALAAPIKQETTCITFLTAHRESVIHNAIRRVSSSALCAEPWSSLVRNDEISTTAISEACVTATLNFADSESIRKVLRNGPRNVASFDFLAFTLHLQDVLKFITNISADYGIIWLNTMSFIGLFYSNVDIFLSCVYFECRNIWEYRHDVCTYVMQNKIKNIKQHLHGCLIEPFRLPVER